MTWTLLGTVFVTSLLGSPHCAGMCGVFVAFAVHPGGPSIPRSWTVQAAYNGGRLATYTALGLLAGAAGATLDRSAALFGVQRAALILAGLGLIGFGTLTLLQTFGVRIRGLAPPALLAGAGLRLQATLRRRGPIARAWGTGLFSTFLPCGWLYAFAVVAAGTGSAAAGAATMATFWLGSLPMMLALGTGIQRLAGPLRRHLPRITALSLVLAGAVTISGRFALPAPAISAPAEQGAEGVEETLRRIRVVGDSGPDCHSRNR